MVALGFMFKLFFIKSNLRFNLSSFLSFSVNGILIFWIQDPQLLLWSQSEDTERRLESGSGNRTAVAFLTGRAAPPSQEDKVESFCVCCACERCMDF